MRPPWPKVRLGEVLKLDLDRVPVDPSMSYPMVGVLSFGRGLFEREPIENGKTSYRVFYRLKAEHIVMSQLFGWEGALALSSEKFAGRFLSPQFPTFSCDSAKLDREYLGWQMRRSAFWDDLSSRTSGMGDRRRTLNPEALFACEIPLPPLAEQRRVVARIEELVAQINNARMLRNQAAEESEAFVRATRNRCVSELRQKYCDTTLGEVCTKITDGPHVSPHYVEKGVPFISVRNINETGLDFSTAKFISASDHAEYSKKAKVERGDVLYTKGGTTGVARRVDTNEEFSIWVHVALLKLRNGVANAGFTEHMLNSPTSIEQAEFFTRGSSNRDLGLSRMAKIRFPLPPISEQRRIASRLDALQAEVDALKRLQTETAAELDALLPAILDRAFKGEL